MTHQKARILADIQTVIEYIHHHPWEDLSLHALGNLTRLTPHYFHRIFKNIVQETLYDYIRRVRINMAARRLIFDDSSVTHIAEECGFNSLASFSRTFKQLRGISPSKYRERYRMSSRTVDSFAVERFRHRMTEPGSKDSVRGLEDVIAWARVKVQETTITHIPDVQVIYYRHQGAFLDQLNISMANLFSTLYREAARHGYVSRSSKMIALSYDDPHITAHDKCRFEVCMTIEGKLRKLPQHVESKIIPGGKYVLLSIAQIPTISSFLWELVVQEWLPHSGYYWDLGRPTMEIYVHSPKQDPYNRQVFDLYIPVRTNAIF
ncbi:AraC family transcriptional regulator [Paenibacillus plantarum]|uniref:AraC family transcriptional regulator n=1 Tax=Paenibacillus plantarum TaxID=2654975 RepID=UPI0014910ACC|nr:GyrI-like domain-containing protein [Paenibacillus plantarum]